MSQFKKKKNLKNLINITEFTFLKIPYILNSEDALRFLNVQTKNEKKKKTLFEKRMNFKILSILFNFQYFNTESPEI